MTDATPDTADKPSPSLTIAGDPLESLNAATWALAAMAATMHAAQQTSLAEALAADPERTAVLAALGLLGEEAGRADSASRAENPALRQALRLADDSTAAAAASHNAVLSSLHQAARAASGDPLPGWGDQDDEVLLRQGRASAGTGRALAGKIVPQLSGLADRLAVEGAQILDVGTGIAALAIELARNLPQASVLGVDIAERPLELARREIESAADIEGRVSARRQDITDLADVDAFDLVWFPAPFLSAAVIDAAIPRMVAALRTGGWIVMGTNPPAHDPLKRAVGRWTAALNGGSAYDCDEAAEVLTASGMHDVRRFPTVPGGPVLVAGRK